MSDGLQRRLTDEQLQTVNLEIGDPLQYEGLSHERPDTAHSPTILAEYHLDPENQLHCSYCEQRQVHQNGFIVEFAPGTRHLVGGECGEKKLGASFKAAKNKHKDLLDRQRYLERIRRLVSNRDALEAGCDAVLFGEALRAVDGTSKTLKNAASDAYIRLQSMSRTSDHLFEFRRVRDYVAERERDEKLADNVTGDPIYKTERVPLGPLQGRAIFAPDNTRQAVFLIKAELRGLAEFVRSGTDTRKTREIQRALKKLDEQVERGRGAVAALRRAPEFFDQLHLQHLARWSRGSASNALTFDQGEFRAGGRLIEAVGPWTVPDLPSFD